jgi:hypothetical protein
MAGLGSGTHVRFLRGQGCPAIYEVGRAQKSGRAKIFLAGENRAVRGGTRQGKR